MSVVYVAVGSRLFSRLISPDPPRETMAWKSVLKRPESELVRLE